MIKIKLDDSAVLAALAQLKSSVQNTRPAMADIGEYLIESTHQRFEKGEGPDGEKWAANKESTILQMLSKKKGNYKKKGGRSAQGRRRAGNKKPLIGETKQLKNVHKEVTDDTVKIGSSRIYAAVQQFGASKGEFGKTKRGAPIPWGDIPARPYLGISDDDRSVILDILSDYLTP